MLAARAIDERRIGLGVFHRIPSPAILGGALAPAMMLGLSSLAGAGGGAGPRPAPAWRCWPPLPLALAGEPARGAAPGGEGRGGGRRFRADTGGDVMLTVFFTLLALSTGGIQNFLAVVLVNGRGVDFPPRGQCGAQRLPAAERLRRAGRRGDRRPDPAAWRYGGAGLRP